MRPVDPELRIFAFSAASPLPALLGPVLFSLVALFPHKVEVLGVADQFLAYVEGVDLCLVRTELVVPAVVGLALLASECEALIHAAELDVGGGDLEVAVGKGLGGFEGPLGVELPGGEDA